MMRCVATTRDSVEEIAEFVNETAAACGGEVASIQVIKLDGPMDDDGTPDYFFAVCALIRSPERRVVDEDELCVQMPVRGPAAAGTWRPFQQ